jgi:hypothetical protein
MLRELIGNMGPRIYAKTREYFRSVFVRDISG